MHEAEGRSSLVVEAEYVIAPRILSPLVNQTEKLWVG